MQGFLADAAREFGLWIVGGTLAASRPTTTSTCFNSSLVYSPDGECVARYDKIHLFFFDNGRERYDERRVIAPGTQPVVLRPALARRPQPGACGMSVCYDLRFPELYRALARQGADLLLVPSAFTRTTGAAHWEVLLRARAIENLAWVVAPAQGGTHENGRHTWGQSMVVDPWGTVAAQQAEGEAVVLFDIDAAQVERARAQLPGAGPQRDLKPSVRAFPARRPRRVRPCASRGCASCARSGGAGSSGCCWRCWCWRCWSRWSGWPAGTRSSRRRPCSTATPPMRWPTCADGLQRNAQSLRASLAAGVDREQWEGRRAGAAARAPRMAAARMARRRRCARSPRSTRPIAAQVFDEDEPRRRADPTSSWPAPTARKLGAPAYSPSHYVAVAASGGGIEVMELCVPVEGGGYLVAGLLAARHADRTGRRPRSARGQEVAFTEADGTRLVALGAPRRIGTRVFTSQQLIDLPGATLMLRVDGWRAVPDLFPNMLTALVTAISIALVSVLVLLARDTRRRLRAERDLADALAFRKAMEDSVITGLRARDLQGRITYVNPAFCEMVGFSPEELMAERRRGALLAHRAGARVPAAAGARAWRAACRRAKASSRSSCARTARRFPVLIFEAPLINAHKVQTGWMSAFIDISEQRRIEELSRASQERLQASARLATVGEMASLLSHELTQPLAAIASYASGSLNLLGPDAARKRRPGGGRDGGAAHCRAGRPRRPGDPQRARLRAPARPHARGGDAAGAGRCGAAAGAAAGAQARRAHRAGAGRPPARRSCCDRTLVEQVLLNLARNGMQAMDIPELAASRVLRLRVVRAPTRWAPRRRSRRRWLEFSVADLGCGISEEVADAAVHALLHHARRWHGARA